MMQSSSDHLNWCMRSTIAQSLLLGPSCGLPSAQSEKEVSSPHQAVTPSRLFTKKAISFWDHATLYKTEVKEWFPHQHFSTLLCTGFCQKSSKWIAKCLSLSPIVILCHKNIIFSFYSFNKPGEQGSWDTRCVRRPIPQGRSHTPIWQSRERLEKKSPPSFEIEPAL